MSETTNGAFPRLPTGIEGFDVIAEGGLPRGRTTLVGGTAGSGKTIFAAQFLADEAKLSLPVAKLELSERTVMDGSPIPSTPSSPRCP